MIAAALALAASQAPATPRAFIAYVYSQYRHEGFSPLAEPMKFFSPELAAAIRKDSSGGEVGYLDGDPLCDCQDYERVSAQVRRLTQPNPSSATARVHVVLGPKDSRDLELRMTLTPNGWRISDVTGGDRKSLLSELRHSNKSR